MTESLKRILYKICYDDNISKDLFSLHDCIHFVITGWARAKGCISVAWSSGKLYQLFRKTSELSKLYRNSSGRLMNTMEDDLA